MQFDKLLNWTELMTHPSCAIEFSQQEEDVLLARIKRLVLTAAQAVVRSHREAGGQLPKASCDVGVPLVQLSQLTSRATLQGHLTKQLNEVKEYLNFLQH